MRKLYLLILLGFTFHLSFSQPEYLTQLPSQASNFIGSGNILYFTLNDGLCRLTENEDGYTVIHQGLKSVQYRGTYNTKLYFLNEYNHSKPEDAYLYELYESDGTSEGTLRLDQNVSTQIYGLNKYVIYSRNNGGKWELVNREQRSTLLGSFTSIDGFIGALGNSLYFFATDSLHGKELWKTDGTVAGTTIVKDINPGTANGVFQIYPPGAIANNLLFFIASDGMHGGDLWKSDGTEAGTTMVKDNPSVGTYKNDTIYYKNPDRIISAGDKVFYVGAEDEGAFNVYLFTSDGTEAGTSIVTGFETIEYFLMNGIDGKLIFISTNDGVTFDVMRSDGTEAGTYGMMQIHTPDASFRYLCKYGNTLLYSTDFETYNYQLIQTDGTTASVLHSFQNNYSANALPVGKSFFFIDDSQPYVEVNDYEHMDPQLWEYNSGSQGMIKDKYGDHYKNPGSLTNKNDVLYFTANYNPQDNTVALYRYGEEAVIDNTRSSKENNMTITAYPNPAIDEIKIETSGISSGTVEVSISDPSGKELYSGAFSAGPDFVRLPIDRLEKGMYIVTVTTAEGRGIARIVKN